MSAAYFSAAVPEPFRVLGLTLRPLSLGRYRLLQRFECAFVADGAASADMPDLLIGVLICSMRCDEFLTWANSPDFAKDVRAWSARISPWPWVSRLPGMGKWWRRNHSFDALEKLQLFRRYVEEGSRVPKFWDEGSGGQGSGAHWAQGVEVALRAEVGWTKEEIDEEPLSKAMADYCKWLEAGGQIRLMTEAEIQQIENAANAPAAKILIAGREATEQELQAFLMAPASQGGANGP
jgi:hypothetical protein